jgi:hypothetical protein
MNIQKTQYTIASGSDASQYISQAKEWFNYERGNEGFQDVGSVTIRAIAEFLANKDGKTLFKAKA